MMTNFAKPLFVVLLSMLAGSTTSSTSADDVDIIKKEDVVPNQHLAWTKVPLENVKKNLNNLQVVQTLDDEERNHRDDSKNEEEIKPRKNGTSSRNNGGADHNALLGMIMKHASITRVGTRRHYRYLQDECDRELEDVIDCGTSERCLDCVLEVTESRSTFDGCSDLEDHYCEELSDCERSCGSCMDEIIELLDCFLDSNDDFSRCDITDCPDSSEERVDDDDFDNDVDYGVGACNPVYAEVVDCGPSGSCDYCVLEAQASRLYFEDCADFEGHLCRELSYCELECGSCIDEWLEFLECTYDIVPFDTFLSRCSLVDCPFL